MVATKAPTTPATRNEISVETSPAARNSVLSPRCRTLTRRSAKAKSTSVTWRAPVRKLRTRWDSKSNSKLQPNQEPATPSSLRGKSIFHKTSPSNHPTQSSIYHLTKQSTPSTPANRVLCLTNYEEPLHTTLSCLMSRKCLWLLYTRVRLRFQATSILSSVAPATTQKPTPQVYSP